MGCSRSWVLVAVAALSCLSHCAVGQFLRPNQPGQSPSPPSRPPAQPVQPPQRPRQPTPQPPQRPRQPTPQPTPRRPQCDNRYQCPANSNRKPNRGCYDNFDDCQCNPGFQKQGNRCVPLCSNSYTCPANSFPIPNRGCYDNFDDCQCNRGYKKQGNRCVPECDNTYQCPANSVRKVGLDCYDSFDDCVCLRGYERVDRLQSCVPAPSTEAPTAAPTAAPTPYPANPNPEDYVEYIDKNAYAPFGAIDIDTDSTAPSGLSIGDCEDRCTYDYACSCVTYERATGKCWKRSDCVAEEWTSDFNAGYNVYLKVIQPTPQPTPVPTPMPTAVPTALPSAVPTPAPEVPTSAPVTVMPSVMQLLGYHQLQWSVNTSYCMSASSPFHVTLSTCASTLDQYLKFDDELASVGYLRFVNSPETCVAIPEDSQVGVLVQMETCNATSSAAVAASRQTWTRQWTCMSENVTDAACAEPTELSVRIARGDYVMIKSALYPELCLDIVSSTGFEGEPLQLGDCNEFKEFKTWKYSIGVAM